MIAPETLTAGQKRFLHRRFRLDVENRVRSRRRHRFQIMFLWVLPLIALGLIFVDDPANADLAHRPTEILAWSLTAVLFAAEPLVWLWIWRGTSTPPTDEGKRDFEWYVLFRDRIGLRSPELIRWTHRISTLTIAAAALATGRPALAVAWLAAIALGVARHAWEMKAVKRALAEIDG